MDNVCHTLVGAALARSGLRHRTGLATATLLIGANLPDLDVLVFATDMPSIAFRRGWTHGVLAQVTLPLLLTIVMVIVGRRRARSGAAPVSAPWLLLLAYLGVFSHVFLDFLNTYGIRLLAPLNWRWFYGDTLFVLDPWLWLTLGIGVWGSRRRESALPARMALGLATLYIAGMMVTARGAHDAVVDAWQEQRGQVPVAAMVGPVPITPFERAVVIDAGDHYETGTFSLLPPRVVFDGVRVEKNDRLPEALAARQETQVSAFLVWSRFPFFEFDGDPGGTRVSVGDMRFANTLAVRNAVGRGQFMQSVVIPRAD